MIDEPEVKSVQAAVTLTRIGGAAHCITIDMPDGRKIPLFLDTIPASGTQAAFIHWADFHLNRPQQPIEELVDDFQKAVYEDTVNRSVYSHEKGTAEQDKHALLAAIQQIVAQREHWKANQDDRPQQGTADPSRSSQHVRPPEAVHRVGGRGA